MQQTESLQEVFCLLLCLTYKLANQTGFDPGREEQIPASCVSENGW